MRASAAGLFAVLATVPASAQEMPPPEAARGASLSTGSVSFREGSVSFSEGSVSLSEGSVSLPTGSVVQPEQGGGRELRFQLTADLLFDFDKADLRPEAEGLLQAVMAQIKEKAKKPAIRVEGHTDGKGSDEYNQDLSERRAASVKNWFVKTAKLSSKTVNTAGFGKRQPVAPNEKNDGTDDPEGRQKNRRVEIVVTGGR
jgi:outer membrane protein OmpA-like peptidoglycan-associated protein